MDIEKLIQKEAHGDDHHDKAYAESLRFSHEKFKELPLKHLKECQKFAREDYNGLHVTVAPCVVLRELIKEKTCAHGSMKYHVHQDVLERWCLRCAKEIDFVCLHDIENQAALEKIFTIMKEYEGKP